MLKENILTQLQEIFRKVLRKPDLELNGHEIIGYDLRADSLDKIEAVMEIESTWMIDISDEEAAELKSIHDIVNLICFKKNV